MKKKVLFVASLFLATATFAQDGLTSKKGEAYLPEAGDWSIGFDATSLTSFVGNAFNGSGNNLDTNGTLLTGTGNSLNAGGWMNGSVGQELRAKMFKDETTAYRLRVRIGFGSSGGDYYGKYDHDNNDSTAVNEYIVNVKNSQGFSVVLGAGLEKRRGNTRIQGYYGGEVFFGLLGGASSTYDDGRVLSDDWGVSGMSDTDMGYTTATNWNGDAVRVTESKAGSTLLIGLQGFVGVEWFFAPKVSLGAEYTWGFNFQSTGEGERTVEYWGVTEVENALTGVSNHLVTETSKTSKTGSLSLDTGGLFALNLAFHF